MDNTEKIILLILILCRRHRRKRNYWCNTFKPQLQVRDTFLGIKQHFEFHWLVQELKLKRQQL